MAYFENESRELSLKLVYYGPPLSGKTTNLQCLHRFLKPSARGRLMKLDAADDRTLFCDFLPVFWNGPQGLRVKLNLYTVPGQFMHRTTRKLLLAETDGVIFVADSQVEEAQENENSWRSMKKKLLANGLDPDATPIVVQFNKHDLPAARGAQELAMLQEGRSEPIYTAAALQGVGVLEAFFACMRLVFRSACTEFELDKEGISEGLLLRELANQLELSTVGANLDEVVRSFTANAEKADGGITPSFGVRKDVEP